MKIFRIPKVPTSSHKSIRFPDELIKEVEKAIEKTNCTFTAFVVEAVRVAIENVKEGGEVNEKENETKD